MWFPDRETHPYAPAHPPAGLTNANNGAYGQSHPATDQAPGYACPTGYGYAPAFITYTGAYNLPPNG